MHAYMHAYIHLHIHRVCIHTYIKHTCIRKGDTLVTCSMVCNRSLQLLGNPMLARLITEGGSVDMSVDNMHHNIPRSSLDLKTALSLFSLLSPKINMFCYCASKVTKDHFLKDIMALNGLCVPL